MFEEIGHIIQFGTINYAKFGGMRQIIQSETYNCAIF